MQVILCVFSCVLALDDDDDDDDGSVLAQAFFIQILLPIDDDHDDDDDDDDDDHDDDDDGAYPEAECEFVVGLQGINLHLSLIMAGDDSGSRCPVFFPQSYLSLPR